MGASGRSEWTPLVMRFGAFGDMVLLTILLRHLWARFGRPVDVISSGVWSTPLLEGQPGVGRVFTVRSRRQPYWLSRDQQRLVRWLRERGAGPTWYCDLRKGEGLLARAGITADQIVDSRAYAWRAEEGFADRYIRLGNETPPAYAGRLPPAPPDPIRRAQIELTGAARQQADAWLARQGLLGRPYVVVHPGSRHVARRWLRSRKGAEKYWPEERWARVLRGVREASSEFAILLTGTASEHRMNEEIVALAHLPNVHNVANGLDVRTLLPVLERAHSVISVDTGPAHAAAALDRPTVALFGPASPILFRPGGASTPAVALTGEMEGKTGILGISVETVLAAWTHLVRNTSKPPVHSVK